MSVESALLIALAVLLGNAFFVGAEFALVSARRSNIELAALNGSRMAKLTLTAMEQVSLMLAGAQLGVTLCSLILGAVGEPLIANSLAGPLHELGVSEHFIHPIAFAIALLVMVYAHVVIGEMVPKNLSLSASTRAALVLVPVLYFFVRVTRPVVASLNAIANACLHLLGITPNDEIRSSFNRDEVAGFIKESHSGGLLSEAEESLLSGTLGFDERTIKRIILPLDKIITTSVRPTPLEIEQLASRTGYSRFPVPSRDQVGYKGYVHAKDVLSLSAKAYGQPVPARLIRPLGSVKATSSLRDALATMQKSGAHVTTVMDGHGNAIGVVMLEDILEELVGPIGDETERNKPLAKETLL